MNGPVVLLDRDGTIIVERDYLSDPDGVLLERHAFEGLRRLTEAGALLLVVTNQSGVGRGYFDVATVDQINARISALLVDHGIEIAGWYICPHAPGAACSCRKPAPGLMHQAVAAHGFDPAHAYVVGDKMSDVGLAHATGATPLLVRTGYGLRAAETLSQKGVEVVDDLLDAADWIVEDFHRRMAL